MKKSVAVQVDPEIVAISAVHNALKDLDPEAQVRVLDYVAVKLKIGAAPSWVDSMRNVASAEATEHAPSPERQTAKPSDPIDELEGISPGAKKWMARNDLKAKQLVTAFSLGVDEIDLIAKTVPGDSKKERMRGVFLLKGVAAYLGTGVSRFTHEQAKETCLHYDAYDAANFAAYIKSLSHDVAGTKETGYTLTPSGLASATEIVKSITQRGKTPEKS